MRYSRIGDGRFQKNKDSGSDVASFDIAIGDFNSDGKLDVARAGYSSSTQGVLQILLGRGDGTFNVVQKINLSTTPDSITTTHFNGDGKLDLAIAMDRVYFYKGAGTAHSAAQHLSRSVQVHLSAKWASETSMPTVNRTWR
jgi:hypothetical protein